MRILAVSRRFPPDVRTGRAVGFASLVSHLRERHELRLVAGYNKDRGAIPQDALGVDLRTRGMFSAHLALYRAVRSAARRFQPHVILSGSVDVPLFGWPTVAVVRDLAGTGGGEDAPPKDPWHRWRMRRFERLVVPSHTTQRALCKLGVPSGRIAVIPEGVPLSHQRRGDREPGPLRVVHCGRVLPAKGQHLSVDAISRLSPQQKSRVELQIVGRVVDRLYYDQLRVAARGQPVVFHPDVPSLDPFLSRADLVLYPTALQDEWADTALHAMAWGAPVAWSDHPGVREATGGLGVPIPPGDFSALRDVVRRLVEKPLEFQQIGVAGQLFVASNYDWRQVCTAWSQLLEVSGRKAK
ncbi:MAG: glycosyltransferase [Rhodobacterales bacterium]|nr:glycosyltransferase [Rhodobacterales bacterium]